MKVRMAPLVLALAVAAPTGPRAATLTWDGDGPNANWSALNTLPGPAFGRTNWVSAFALPVNGDHVVFAGSRQLSSTQDLPLLFSVGSLSFSQGAGAFTLGGSQALAILGSITNASSAKQTLTMPLMLGSASTWDGGSGGLDVTGLLSLGDMQLTALHGTAIDNAGRDWVVGAAGAGSVTLASGSSVAVATATFGRDAGATGSLELSGTGTRWTTGDTMTVGASGKGFLSVQQGAQLRLQPSATTSMDIGSDAGSSGQVVVTGSGSLLKVEPQFPYTMLSLHVGASGTGRLLIDAGGVMEGGSVTLGAFNGSTGFFTVAGQNSRWRGDTVQVGSSGYGEMLLSGGGRVDASVLRVGGSAAGGLVRVVGPGALLNVSGLTLVGDVGHGAIEVTGGGSFASDYLDLGSTHVGADGRFSVRGAGSAASVQRNLLVGSAGKGTLEIDDQGALRSAAALLGRFDSGRGLVTVRGGGRWDNDGQIEIGGQGSGVLTVDVGGTVVTGTLLISPGSVATITGGVLEAATLGGGGTLALDTGTLRLAGAATSALGAVLPISMSLGRNAALEVRGTLEVGAGRTLTLAGGSFQAGTLALTGGRVTAIGGATFDMSRVALLQGQGTVAGAVAGGASSQIVADGPLVLGDASRSDGFVYDGTLLTHGQRVELRSAGWSQLGTKNTLESGAVLAAANGVALLAGARLVADGDVTIDAEVWQRGQVASGGTLTFAHNVLGGGGFEGASFAFLAGFAPGDGVATVDFGGADTTFGVDSVLVIQIAGVASHDRLTGLHAVHFDGALHLDFGPGFDVGTATTIDLLDFVAFDGGTTLPPRVVVSGFDAARLDLSRLDIDGTLTIAAVPEPAAVALLLLGLAAIGPPAARARRSKTAAPPLISASTDHAMFRTQSPRSFRFRAERD